MLQGEEGVSLVLTALTLLVLLALTAFVTDLGVMWTARGQAQNAADAGALAGATARALDEWTDPPAESGLAYQSAYDAARANSVFGEAPATTVSWTCPDWFEGSGPCVRVDVFRDGTNDSDPLPRFFSSLIPSSADMRARATATAGVQDVNHSDCLKPWLIPDKFTDTNGNGVFDLGLDFYTAPGFTESDIGTTLMLRPGKPQDAAAPSNYYGIGDANTYRDAIVGCIIDASIGDTIDTMPGGKVGSTRSGVTTLLANGPVIVTVGLFSPVAWAESDRNTGTFPMVVTNIMGFRIDDISPDGTIYGIIDNAPSDANDSGGDAPPPGASFLKNIFLLR